MSFITSPAGDISILDMSTSRRCRILLLRLSQLLLGDSLFAIRLLPALAGAAIVALTGIIAREIGGRAWAIALACAGSLCALFNLAVGNFFSTNAFEPLFWMGSVYLLVRIINGGSPTLWLWFGVLLGLGFENKHSTAFFAVGIFLALLLTRERRHFAKKMDLVRRADRVRYNAAEHPMGSAASLADLRVAEQHRSQRQERRA